MSSRKTAKLAFGTAIVLLLFCGVAAMIAVGRYSLSAQWVDHTYDVKVSVSQVESTLAEAARDRLVFITSGDRTYLDRYESASKEASAELARVRQLVADNPTQQLQVDRLENLVQARLALLRKSLDARASGQPDADVQSSVSVENTKVATDIGDAIRRIEDHEDALLGARKKASSRLLTLIIWIFAVMLCGALVLFWVHYRLLAGELRKREEAENSARSLSVHVLELQDEERRKFSRELHDGLGQILALAKLIAQGLGERHPSEEKATELIELLDRSIQETRTISYLLHPPLLDEMGIASAASWYLDGFSKRSGVQVAAKIPEEIVRLPRPVELVLFRVLQESLTNVHRHSKSQRAEVAMFVAEGNAVLRIRDHGVGIPSDKLKLFQTLGAGAGVGLTGMRERVREHGGEFEIRSDGSGTEVTVRVPLSAGAVSEPEAAAAGNPA